MSNLLTVAEVAKTLRVDPTTVRRWIKLGILHAVILPHRGPRESYRIKRETLDRLFEDTASSSPFSREQPVQGRGKPFPKTTSPLASVSR